MEKEGGGRERERERESVNSGLLQSVRVFLLLLLLILFHVMGLVLQVTNGAEKNALLLLRFACQV